MWAEEPRDVAVVAEDEELVCADQPGDQVQVEQLDLEPLAETVQLLKEFLGKALRIVEEVEGGEVEGLNFLLLFLFPGEKKAKKEKSVNVYNDIKIKEKLFVSFIYVPQKFARRNCNGTASKYERSCK